MQDLTIDCPQLDNRELTLNNANQSSSLSPAYETLSESDNNYQYYDGPEHISDPFDIDNFLTSLQTELSIQYLGLTTYNPNLKDKDDLRFLKDQIIDCKTKINWWIKIIDKQRRCLIDSKTNSSSSNYSGLNLKESNLFSNGNQTTIDKPIALDISQTSDGKNRHNLIKVIIIALLGLCLALYIKQ